MSEPPLASISDEQIRPCWIVVDRDDAMATRAPGKVMVEHRSIGEALEAADRLARAFPGRRFWVFACTGQSRGPEKPNGQD